MTKEKLKRISHLLFFDTKRKKYFTINFDTEQEADAFKEMQELAALSSHPNELFNELQLYVCSNKYQQKGKYDPLIYSRSLATYYSFRHNVKQAKLF